MKRIIAIIGFAMALCCAQDAVAQEFRGTAPQGDDGFWVGCHIFFSGPDRKVSAHFRSDIGGPDGTADSGKVSGKSGKWNEASAGWIKGDHIVYQRCNLYHPQNPNSIFLSREYSYWKERVNFNDPPEGTGTIQEPEP